MEKISVIVPVYNTGDILHHCLDSIIKNTYKNLEIICINDGSTDNSLSVLQKFAGMDDRIIIIDKQNSGVSHSRNVGLTKATGDYIAFIDSDDYVHPQYFEILINALRFNNADIAISNYEEVYDFEKRFDIYNQAPEFKQLSYDHLKPPHSLRSYVWGRIYKKSLFEGRFFDADLKLFEDKFLSISILCDFPDLKIISTSLPLYFYYVRENSAMRTSNNHLIIQHLKQILHNGKKYNNNALFCDEVFRYSMAIYEHEYHSSTTSKEILREAKSLMRSAYCELKKSSVFTAKHKLIYSTLARFPSLYHIVYSVWKSIAKNKKLKKSAAVQRLKML